MYLTCQYGQPLRGGTYLTGAALSRRRSFRRGGLGSLGQPISAAVKAGIAVDVQAGQLVKADGSPIYIPGSQDCAGSKSVAKPLITTATGVAGGLLLQAGMKSGNPYILAAGAASELASLIFGVIFGHHAAAVQKEQSVLCAAVPAANDSLQVIEQAVQSGQFTPQNGITALDNLVSGFQSAVQPILKMNSSQCNAACVMIMGLKAIVAKKKADYAALAAQQAAHPVATALQPITNAFAPVQAAIASAGLPSWILPAAGFFLLYELL